MKKITFICMALFLTIALNAQKSSKIPFKKKYSKKMGKALSPLIALRFFQLEEFIQSEIRTAILEIIPIPDNY